MLGSSTRQATRSWFPLRHSIRPPPASPHNLPKTRVLCCHVRIQRQDFPRTDQIDILSSLSPTGFNKTQLMCLPRPCSISLCLGPNPYSPLESVKTQNETFQRTGSKDVLFEMPHVPPHTHTATADKPTAFSQCFQGGVGSKLLIYGNFSSYRVPKIPSRDDPSQWNKMGD